MVIKKNGEDVYEFDDKAHRHRVNGHDIPGVTTLLKTISPVSFDEDGQVQSKTDMLMAWAVKLCVQEMASRSQEYIDATEKERENIIKEVKRAHREARDGAGNYGSAVHDILDRMIKREPVDAEALMRDAEKARAVEYAMSVVRQFTVVRNECHVWSTLYQYGGIFDLLLRDGEGKLWLADFKTSKSVHPEMFYQMGGYHVAMDELGMKEHIVGYMVIHIPRVGDCGTYTNADCNVTIDDAKSIFMSALNIYKLTINHGLKK